jgi:hypothetical protein
MTERKRASGEELRAEGERMRGAWRYEDSSSERFEC